MPVKRKLLYVIVILGGMLTSAAQSVIEPYRQITVSKEKGAAFQTIQEAVNATRDLGPGYVLIHIRNGVYREKVSIPGWKTKVILRGESREGTVIVNSDFSGKKDSITGQERTTFNSYTLLVEGNDFTAENLTVKNASCGEGQAVALHVEGDRAVFRNCRILGCQDTVYAAAEGSRQYYENCYVEGTTDFIFGEATAVFSKCTIKSLRNSYITAAATPEGKDFGFVFLHCRLVAAEGVSGVFLGRPWRPYAKTVFISCNLGGHIVPEGWDPWKGDRMFPEKEKTAFYAEYDNTGPGADTGKRVPWAKQLTRKQYRSYTLRHILMGKEKENPWYKRSL
ncbi:pectin esterase [Sinomicrobium soli]|nr:pectin esterase [Sinomicrobium sp. N-1-3-6]